MSLLYWFREEEADYVASIQILKSEKPLLLPAIKPLKAKRKVNVSSAEMSVEDRHLGAVAG